MTDNITLPRADAKVLRELLEAYENPDWWTEAEYAALTALDAALAEPEKERAETGIPARGEIEVSTGKSYRTTEPPAKPEPVHPGYIIGSHWLETAYSRIAAGEAEAEVLTEVLGARGWVKPEPATDEQVTEADENHEPSWIDYRDGWRAAERWHGITKEDKT